MAISKSIPIRVAKADPVGNALNYIMDESKTSTEIYQNFKLNTDITESNLESAFEYINNPEKTTTNEKVVLISGFRCNPTTASIEFKIISEKYHLAKSENISREEIYCKDNKKSSGKLKCAREAYHFIQSFPKGLNIEPKLIHHIGMEFGERLGNEEYQFVCTTHLNTDCLHNHIIMNAYNLDNISKYRDSKAQLHRMRKINDELSREYGLPVLLDTENNKGKSYAEIVAEQKGESWKETVCIDIENAKISSYCWNDYYNIMVESGYQIKENKKSLTYVLPDGKKVMDSTLGQEYTKNSLQKHWDKTYKDNRSVISKKIIEEMAVLHKKRINNYIDNIDIKIYRYTFTGRRRSDIEILLIFAIKVLFIIAVLLKLFFSNQEQDTMFKSVEWKINKLSEALACIEKMNIRSQTELDEQIKQSRIKFNQLLKEASILTSKKKTYSELYNSAIIVKYLQGRMMEMGINRKTLGIETPDEKTIRTNKAHLDPMSPTQQRNLFLAVSNSKSHRLTCKYDEITAIQSDEIIDYLKSPQTYKKPEMIITLAEFDIIRKKNMQDTINKRKMGIRASLLEANKSDNLNNNQEYIRLLKKFDSEEKERIVKYRGALNHLLQFGFDDINSIEIDYNNVLDYIVQKEQEIKDLDLRYKQLSLIKTAVSYTDNKSYLYGPLHNILQDVDLRERIKTIEVAEPIQQRAEVDLLERDSTMDIIR